jgi:F-type H+-transporting ATPase subunit delta
VDEWERLLADLAAVLEQPAIGSILSHPRASPEDRLEVLELALARRLELPERNFLKLLIAYKRWRVVGDIASFFAEMKQQAASETECEVTTAFAVAEATRTEWMDGLMKRLGRRVHLVFQVEPALIGGAQLRIGDRIWDGSVRGRLALLSRVLARPIEFSRG